MKLIEINDNTLPTHKVHKPGNIIKRGDSEHLIIKIKGRYGYLNLRNHCVTNKMYYRLEVMALDNADDILIGELKK